MPTVVPFADRPEGKTICLFDVDGTLSAARLSASQEMLDLLKQVRAKAVIGFVGGSDLPKITEQLAIHGQDITEDFDYCFAENGLTAIKLGKTLSSESFIGFIGEEKYQKLVSFILHYIADLVIPVKRGTFVEFRNGMVNVSPIGRNASQSERMAFEAYDKIHKIRATMIEAIKAKFPDYGLTYSIGGQLSFDMFPTGWDKTFALNHIKDEGFTAIHFFGDKTYKGGNDYEIYEDPRTIGHAVTCPEDTMAELRKLFNL